LPLGRDGVRNALEELVEDKRDRASVRGISIESAGIMFGNTPFKAAACCSDAVGTVRAAEHVEDSSSHSSFGASLREAPKDEEFLLHFQSP
jgi:hypothetical protein